MNNNDIPNTEFIKSSLSDSVLTITLNRPEAMNAFRPEMLEAIAELIEKSSENQSVSVVVLEGEGRAFSAGVDLKVLQGIKPKYGQIGDLFNAPAERAVQAIRQCQCPVIAKVHGACFTGALEVALHCDFIYTTVDTKFGDTHAKFGLRPTWGMAQTLSQAVGVRRAKELSYTARVFKGEEAREYGIANEVLADKEALDALVSERAMQIAANSRATVAAMKDLYDIAQSGLGVEGAFAEENTREYTGILDTEERLSNF